MTATYDDPVVLFDDLGWTFDGERAGPLFLVTPVLSYPMDIGYPSLWRHYHIDKGATLVKESGDWTLVTSPSEDRLSAAESYYRGGFLNLVDEDTADELLAAGFAAFIEEVV